MTEEVDPPTKCSKPASMTPPPPEPPAGAAAQRTIAAKRRKKSMRDPALVGCELQLFHPLVKG